MYRNLVSSLPIKKTLQVLHEGANINSIFILLLASDGKLQNRSQADARAAARKIRALQQELHQLSIERQTLIEENEALRQGLHDILDSVHNQDGNSGSFYWIPFHL